MQSLGRNGRKCFNDKAKHMNRRINAAGLALVEQWEGLKAMVYQESLFKKFGLHAHLGIHLLQPTVIFLQSLHLADLRRIHSAVLGSEFVKGRHAHPCSGKVQAPEPRPLPSAGSP